MPFLPSMQALLRSRRRDEHEQAMRAVEEARRVRDEAFARSRLHPAPPLERRAAPIQPPTRKDV